MTELHRGRRESSFFSRGDHTESPGPPDWEQDEVGVETKVRGTAPRKSVRPEAVEGFVHTKHRNVRGVPCIRNAERRGRGCDQVPF